MRVGMQTAVEEAFFFFFFLNIPFPIHMCMLYLQRKEVIQGRNHDRKKLRGRWQWRQGGRFAQDCSGEQQVARCFMGADGWLELRSSEGKAEHVAVGQGRKLPQ